jgi:hypothetical protein
MVAAWLITFFGTLLYRFWQDRDEWRAFWRELRRD